MARSQRLLKRKDHLQDIWLRRIVAVVILIAAVGQLAVADTAFFEFGVGKHWQLSTAAMDAWLGATVVQVIGLMYVLANYLYQRKDGQITAQPRFWRR